MSRDSMERAVEIADWAESNPSHRPVWLHPEYLARFAGSSDAEVRAAAGIVKSRNVEREREIAALEFLKAAMKVVRLGGAT